MIVIKALVRGIITSIISVYAPQPGFDDSLKDHFHDIFGSVVGKLGEKEIAVIAGDFNDHIGINAASLKASIEIMVMELEIRKGKRSWSFVQL